MSDQRVTKAERWLESVEGCGLEITFQGVRAMSLLARAHRRSGVCGANRSSAPVVSPSLLGRRCSSPIRPSWRHQLTESSHLGRSDRVALGRPSRGAVVTRAEGGLTLLGQDVLYFLGATVLVIPTFKWLKISPVLGFLASGVILHQLG